ncbi:hypothetical protein [Paraburkholderia sp. Ac-20347]|jgi:hypothetical protein|uniref:hypothetical protein n=1 Tax=Paraburkholderia sp. Ac-20347 TaxID=2703892 RepID=UPI0019811EEB|nr:hypothetical protein [Paraburkholderia sp. Ac-20347]MBN3812210.1 hypothetical protein [Paraburkholderia sp. Ac-20347]
MSFIETEREKRALHSIGKKPRVRRVMAEQKPFRRDRGRFESPDAAFKRIFVLCDNSRKALQ